MRETILDANVILMDMPATIRAYTLVNADSSYSIVVNARLNHETQLEAYRHELEHISQGDYNKKCSADLIEFYAHK